MLQCQNCGQVNNYQSNFCRFCGTRMVMPQNANAVSDEPAAPRPYMWKSDEYHVNNNPPRRTQRINQVQPIPQQQAMNVPFAQPVMYQKPAYPVAAGYQCPRCRSPHFPLVVEKISTAGWITFGLLLVFFFPLFWIGLLIKENARICPICKLRVD